MRHRLSLLCAGLAAIALATLLAVAPTFVLAAEEDLPAVASPSHHHVVGPCAFVLLPHVAPPSRLTSMLAD